MSELIKLVRKFLIQELQLNKADSLYLNTLPKFEKKKTEVFASTKKTEVNTMPIVPEVGSNAEKLAALKSKLERCSLCNILYKNRTNLVFGSGNPNAEIFIIGEAPGNDEDLQGLPFVGRSGKLLTDIIEKGMGISRETVYIANILKCRPPNNRNPEKMEIATCTPFLNMQLQIIKPKVIITLGNFAAQYISGQNLGITKLRGNFYQYNGIPVMPTYHPSYLLRNYTPEARREVWQDVKTVMDFLKK